MDTFYVPGRHHPNHGASAALDPQEKPMEPITHRDDVRTVYASGAKTRKEARKALADKYAQARGLKPDAKTYFRVVQAVKSEHIRQLLAQPIHDELNQAAEGLVEE